MHGIIALLLAAAAPDPCLPVAEAGNGNPLVAQAYLDVGRAEEKAGALDTATAAFQEALRQGPSAEARTALTRLCRKSQLIQVYEEAVRRMEAGDKAAAAPLFEKVRAGGGPPRATLLEAVCRFDLGQYDQARPLLEEAVATNVDPETARFFLGMIAYRKGDASQAASLLREASQAPEGSVREGALRLLNVVGREGKLVLFALLESGFDSNHDLQPDQAPSLLGTGADGAGALTAGLTARPLGLSGPYLRVLGLYRAQFRYAASNLGAVSGAAGWQLGAVERFLRAEYAYDFAALGKDPYLSLHRVNASFRLPFGPFAFNGLYSLNFQSFLLSDFADYSGTRHLAVLTGSITWGTFLITAGYGLTRGFAQTGALTFWEHGPTAALDYLGVRGLRLTLSVGFSLRDYDLIDDMLGLRRSDKYVDGALLGIWNIDPHWSIQGNVGVRKAFSNLAGIADLRVTAWVGAAYTIGLF